MSAKNHKWQPEPVGQGVKCRVCGDDPPGHLVPTWPAPCRHCGGRIVPDPLHPGMPLYFCTGCYPERATGEPS